MQKRSSLLLASSILLLFAIQSFSQPTSSASRSVTFDKPAGWYEMNRSQRIENFKRFEFTEEDLQKLLTREQTTAVLAVFYRDDPAKTPGIIPTIQVMTRPMGGSPTFTQFKAAFVKSLQSAPGLEEYTVVGDPESIELSGHDAVRSNSRFFLTHQSKRYAIRARTFAIPRGDHFIQISMSGEDDERWTEKEFTNFINSVTIRK